MPVVYVIALPALPTELQRSDSLTEFCDRIIPSYYVALYEQDEESALLRLGVLDVDG